MRHERPKSRIQHGLVGDAVNYYEKFISLWKHADSGIPEQKLPIEEMKEKRSSGKRDSHIGLSGLRIQEALMAAEASSEYSS